MRVLTPKTARAVREMLHLVTQPGGTAPKAQTIGYSVGGKTGTAYKQEGKGYAQKKYRAWFVGMAPALEPAHRRRGDGRRAEQRQVLRRRRGRAGVRHVVQQTLRTLGVQPDLDVQPQIVAGTARSEDESF